MTVDASLASCAELPVHDSRVASDIGLPAAAGGGFAVACLPADLSKRVLAAEPRIVIVPSWKELLHTTSNPRTTTLLIDPADSRTDFSSVVLELGDAYPSRSVVAYTHLTSAVVVQLVKLARVNVSDVILAGFDDHAGRFQALADEAVAGPMSRYMLELLEPHLLDAAPSLKASIRSLYRTPIRFRTASDLAADARMPRRTLYRYLRTAGLKSPRLLVASGRVTRAVAMLGGRGQTLRIVASRPRYSDPAILASHIGELTGMNGRDLRKGVDHRVVAEAVVARLLAADFELEE